MFSKNVGGLDRAVRVVAGLALVAAAVTGFLGPWAYLGVIPLVTAFMGSCPLYNLVGINTCAVSQEETPPGA